MVDPQLTASDLQRTNDLALVELISLEGESMPKTSAAPILEEPKYTNAMDIISDYKVRHMPHARHTL